MKKRFSEQTAISEFICSLKEYRNLGTSNTASAFKNGFETIYYSEKQLKNLYTLVSRFFATALFYHVLKKQVSSYCFCIGIGGGPSGIIAL